MYVFPKIHGIMDSGPWAMMMYTYEYISRMHDHVGWFVYYLSSHFHARLTVYPIWGCLAKMHLSCTVLAQVVRDIYPG